MTVETRPIKPVVLRASDELRREPVEIVGLSIGLGYGVMMNQDGNALFHLLLKAF